MGSEMCIRDSLGDEPVAAALERFEEARRPQVERLQERATRSQLWWESFETRQYLSPARMAMAYLSRAGAVSLDDVLVSDRELAARALAEFAGVGPDEVPDSGLTDWVLGQPVSTPHHQYPRRLHNRPGRTTATVQVDGGDAWGPDGTELIERAQEFLRGGAAVIRLTGEDSQGALLDRLAVGERIRAELPVLVDVAAGPRHLRHAVDGVVAGRTDLVHVTEGS